MSFQSDEQAAARAIETGAYDEAIRLLRPLAERNSAYALLTLGWIYEARVTGTPDRDAARSLYEDAASHGSGDACLYLGRLLLEGQQVLAAREAFERGARLNNDGCKSELARLADRTDEEAVQRAMEEENYEEAIRLLKPLAQRNSPFALRCFAYIYETGVTGAPDMKAARSYYERAASLGRPEDYYELGRFLTVEGDETLARAAFRAGAEHGHVRSMAKLGRMMIEGRGGPVDREGGSEWLEKAVKEHTSAERESLAVAEQKAQSLFEKALVKVKIVRLWFRGMRQVAKGLPRRSR